MYPNADFIEPAGPAGYVPYFYQAGVFARYIAPAVNVPARDVGDGDASPLERISGGAVVPRSTCQTVEQVIAHGYFSVPYANPITALISDKLHASRLGLHDVIHQIRSRYEIYARNMDELNESICEASNSVFRQIAEHGTLVANQRQIYAMTKQVQELYEQQREERLNLWRDVSRLKLGLPESIQGYLTAYRKSAILNSDGGDAL